VEMLRQPLTMSEAENRVRLLDSESLVPGWAGRGTATEEALDRGEAHRALMRRARRVLKPKNLIKARS
jgi:hypothetical protein